MPSPSKLSEFQDLLRRLFQVESAQELNFGIYRIINKKADLIKERLIDQIPQITADALAKIRGGGGIQATQQNLEDARLEIIQTLGEDALTAKGNISKQFANIPIAKKYSKTQTRAQRAGVVHNIENDIYNHLLTFFGSYYQDGDFVPQRQITSRGAYSLPYNGEDVYLHWANRGQYYIKTAEHFHSYAFAANGVKTRFVICEAQDTPQNNNKGVPRFFFPQIADSIWNPKNKELQIPLQHRAPAPKDKLPRTNIQQYIITTACDTAKTFFAKKIPNTVALLKKIENSEDSYLFSHLMKYTRRNDSDFFIHKDLESFLKRELHSTIKSSIINLDEIGGSGGLARAEVQILLARAVQDIGEQIISHLAQLENFQKTLWEKKKFITKTNYIARLGAVLNNANTQTQKNICATICKTNAQWNEWKNLGVLQTAKNVFGKDAKKCAVARQDFINKNFSLPLDTSHFESNFCNLVLSCFDNVEEATDGILIHGENWQALNLLKGKYRRQIKCVYIDPPYNTDASAIIYKNNYKDSSFLSLMQDRIVLSKNLLTNEGILCCAIDDAEVWRLRALLESIFSKEIGIVPVRSNPVGRKSTGQFSPTHEYAIFYGHDESIPGCLEKTEKQISRYRFTDEKGRYDWLTLIRQGANDRREDSPRMFYPIYIRTNDTFRIPKIEWDDEKQEYKILERPLKNEVVIYPIANNGNGVVEKNWHRGWERVKSEPNEYRIIRNRGDIAIQFKTRMDEKAMPQTWWDDKRYASANHGAIVLKKLFGDKPFNFPKSVELVKDCLLASGAKESETYILDYFAGSGTTAHAVINLNREDGGRRKFILVEMGDYFDDVLMKRIKKIIYTPEWKNGNPNGDTNSDFLGVTTDNEPRLIKYHCMESYEDSLDNIEFAGEETLFDGDYESRYMLQWESKESATFAPGGKLDSPFGYTLKRAGKQKNAVADLPETFNYMAGIRLHSRHIEKNGKTNYQIDIGNYGDEYAAFIWRDIAKWKQADYEKERAFIATLKFLRGKKIYTNGTSKIRGALSLSPIFVKHMFAEAE